jgi:uncharacterized iron-regulated protein
MRKKTDDFYVVTKENPFNDKGTIAIIDGTSPVELSLYIPKITHYGKYSQISFNDGKNTSKATKMSEKGIREELVEEIMGIEVQNIINFSDIIEQVSSKDIIYVGESHDRFEHHRVQLEVVRELHKKNKNIAIGMEMFQKPFQKVIDDFINGIIEEREFLKQTEYFKRWGLDYSFYREILLHAREYGIPVIGLNIRREIISKVSKEGLHSLTDKELEEVPEYIDLSDKNYKQKLRSFFERHSNPQDRNFDFFYQAQVLWDETMAYNLDEFMRQNPGYQVVVIAGAGHMAYGAGIPKRAYRLNGKEYSIILNDEDIEHNIADFVLYPPPSLPPESPKLMVMLKEEDGNVKISAFVPESISQKAGLKKDDIILSLDETTMAGIDDIKIFLLYKKKGDKVTVKVSRKIFLFGSVVKEFELTL